MQPTTLLPKFLENKNVSYLKNNETKIVDVGIQYKFRVENNQLIKYQSVEKTGDLSNYFTYNHINAENKDFNELKIIKSKTKIE